MLRVYVLRDNQPHQLAECEDESLAFTLRTLRDEGQITTEAVGVLDKPDADERGRWLLDPFVRRG